QDFEKSLSTSVRTKAELNAQEITLEALTKITLKVGSSFIIVDLTGITIMGPMVNINSGGAAVGTSPAGIDDPVDADTADTGEPGYLDRPRPAGSGGGHHHRTLTPQQGLNVTRNADGSYQVGNGVKVTGNQAFAENALADLSKINETPKGQTLLNDLNTSGKTVTISERPKNPNDPFNAETTADNIADATPAGQQAFAGNGTPVTDSAGNPVTGTGNGSNSSVAYDPTVWPPPPDVSPTGTTSDDTLFHELTHADHHEHGTRDATPRADNFDNEEEHRTITDENEYRSQRDPPLNPITNGHHEI
ncbi:MAG TPA: M91 family zinc metallopeptidase, partial [Pirellulales bacterium]|nr:M91 family zinc metallopeptidase [Pirellulales bacterium]